MCDRRGGERAPVAVLYDVAVSCFSCSERALASADPAPVVQLMTAKLEDAAMQTRLCLRIHNMVDTPAKSLKVAAAGAFEALVACLLRHADNEAVLCDACNALGKMLLTPANVERASGAGAVEAVVAALARHPRSASVQHRASWVLSALLKHAPSQARAVAAGARALLEQAAAFPNDEKVQRWAQGALSQLAK